jgi:hypothetical protein
MTVATQDSNLLERVAQTPKRGHVAVDKPTAVPGRDVNNQALTSQTIKLLTYRRL